MSTSIIDDVAVKLVQDSNPVFKIQILASVSTYLDVYVCIPRK